MYAYRHVMYRASAPAPDTAGARAAPASYRPDRHLGNGMF